YLVKSGVSEEDVVREAASSAVCGLAFGQPGTCAGLVPRETVKLGAVMLPEGKVASILEQMKHQWPSRGYDMLRRNCSHFCDDFCQRLGVGTLPQWVKNMASTGAGIASLSSQVSGTLNSFWAEEEAPPLRPATQRFCPRIQSRQIGEVLPEITRLPGHGMPPMPLRKETHVLRGAGARWGDMWRKVI
ncbi:unnamed protein product, partial [Cladocopium goreaui]